MADRDAIAELLSNYAWAMDAGDFQALNDIFSEDGSLMIHIAGADSIGPISPRDAVVEFIGSTITGQQDQRRHVVSNQRYESEGADDAVVTATLTLNVIADGKLTVQSTGVYRTEVARTEGSWRMRSLSISLDLPF
jgi:3-phenylpropionate/cinnamic acid dioxygenase small subunit